MTSDEGNGEDNDNDDDNNDLIKMVIDEIGSEFFFLSLKCSISYLSV